MSRYLTERGRGGDVIGSIVMVMPYRQLVRKAKEEGFRVGAIWDPALETARYLVDVAEFADDLVLVDFADTAALQRAVVDLAVRSRASAVLHVGREESMLPTYQAAERLGLAVNPSEAIRLVNDKLAMRELLRAIGLSTVRFAGAARVDDVPGLLADFGYPAVVKPTALAGSRGVYLAREPADLATWRMIVESYGYLGPILVEEYLHGPEYSVETLSRDGVHHVLGVTAKQVTAPPLFVELGHVYPAPLPAARTAPMVDLVVRFLTAAGYRFGPAHTEVIWAPDGPKIVESQARLGGDRIPRLVALSTGIDPERAIFTTLAGQPLRPRPHRRSAQVAYFQFPTGVLDEVRGLDEIAALPYVDELVFPFRAGDRFPPTRDSSSRHGHVILTGATGEELAARLARIRALLDVVLRPSDAELIGPAG